VGKAEVKIYKKAKSRLNPQIDAIDLVLIQEETKESGSSLFG
jgi:hypothetical protein